MSTEKTHPAGSLPLDDIATDSMAKTQDTSRRWRLRNPWAWSPYTLLTTLIGFAILGLMVQSFLTRQLDVKGCEMAYMRPMYSNFDNFDTEHTRLASKYSLYLYREWGIDEEFTVKGVPVLFIPGNAGSYKQVRSLASESAYHYVNSVQNEPNARDEKRPLDFFSVDFNEDFTAFHGQTLLDQAEYLNDAITFILSLYHTPGSVQRDSHLPDPTSVIIVGHSMGGVVARTMFTMPNYQANSINTIVTLAAPHARPPVSFDGDIVRIYKGVNDYWRNAYAQENAATNSLWHTTLISIAGGGLDTIVSSDYANTASLIPETHGFTVFTSSIPNVWTGMDHLAITWCDQARKSVVRALYDVIDVSSATQTTPRAKRMRGFKKWFLTGMEDIAEKSIHQQEAQTLLVRKDDLSAVQRLVLSTLGQSDRRPNVHLLKLPAQQATSATKLTLLTNERLDGSGSLDTFFCAELPAQAELAAHSGVDVDLAGEDPNAIRLVCKNAATDAITLPESTAHSELPFRSDQRPFSSLEYPLEELSGFEFMVIVDRSSVHNTGWAVVEFETLNQSVVQFNKPLWSLLLSGISASLPAHHPLSMNIQSPALQSSLLAYNFRLSRQPCEGELFAPLARQYITDVYESKYFVNVKDAEINIHGVSPYLPPALHSKQTSKGLSLQIWADPTCDSGIDIVLKVDLMGSLGKLWMRYRIVFAAFPILIVSLVLREQFCAYDETGVFMSFAQGLNRALHTSLLSSLAALTFLSIALSRSQYQSSTQVLPKVQDEITHELLLGNDDPFFWFLVPLFGIMCIGLCVAINYVALLLEFIFALPYAMLTSSNLQNEDGKRTPSTFSVTSPRRRILASMVLLSLISMVIPYHFAYVVLCIVHLATCIRALRLARDTSSEPNYDFYNYAHSILILMLWILPINMPVLVVWIRNLTVHWLTPFSSHHNILSIMPFVLLVETLSTGHMIPRTQWKTSLATNVLLFSMGAYAAVYGVTYAYVLHQLANVFCAWLVAVHFDASGRMAGRAVG